MASMKERERERERECFSLNSFIVIWKGVSADADPHYQKLYGRVTDVCGNRRGQPRPSAMQEPRPGRNPSVISEVNTSLGVPLRSMNDSALLPEIGQLRDLSRIYFASRNLRQSPTSRG